MAEAIVSDWLAEYNALEPQEIRSFAALHAENHELSTAIQTILNDKTKHSDLLHPICIQLYNFYRSNENELKCFTLQFIPNFIYLYLNAVATGEKQSFRSVETLLLCAYNIEVCNEKGLLKSVSYRMPVLAQASIYHEEKNLHASDLKRWEENSNKEISWSSMKQVDKIIAQNRLTVMAALMFVFNQQLSLIQKSALYHLCKISSKLVSQGFAKHGHSYRSSYGNDPLNNSMSSTSMTSSTASAPSSNKQNPRIPMSQKFLVELLNAIYFAMFNEFASAAIQAVDDIHNRACYELYPDVILVTNAIKNSLQANPSGQPHDGPMGISVALTPATTVVTVSKSMITNASFRTKKLPDDLEIVDLKHLQATQEEMMKKMAILDDESVTTGDYSENSSASATPKGQKKLDGSGGSGSSKRHRWKNWGWKHSPAKSLSIEEEPIALLESPKKSHSSKSSSPNQSPKHRFRINSNEAMVSDSSSPLRRRKQNKSDASRVELRSSAGARLIQIIDNKDGLDKLDADCDEFLALLPENGRPASIHIIQTLSRPEDF